MTMLLQPAARNSRLRPLADDMVVAIDDTTNRIVYFTDDAEAGLMQVNEGGREGGREGGKREREGRGRGGREDGGREGGREGYHNPQPTTHQP